ncbi:MAG: glycosyltransferase [Rhizobiaceae bacterium]|nr:glycosyltransferase [Rhizobiaceae bacterium]MCV0406071.1 glycosyltransferase [Rhizobiaceae bacterium]
MNTHPAIPAVSILARSPNLDAAAIETVVTLPTFRRPEHLLRTLDSLVSQEGAPPFAVIVMENDDEGRAGASACLPMFESRHVGGVLVVAHERGNCSAYNAGWATALRCFPTLKRLVVIDDDEIAEPTWLARMVGAETRLGVDIVGGPQVPVFAHEADARLARHPVFAPPYVATQRVPALYSSGNLLVTARVLAAMPQPHLDTRFNFLGGGDSDFLSRAAARGFRLGWCAEARVMETVPSRRTEGDWIRARAIRNGVISTLVERRKRQDQALGRLIVAGRSLALLAMSPLRGIPLAFKTGLASAYPYPGLVAAGRLMAEFGYMNEQYREPEKN